MKERLADGVRPRTSQAIIYAALGALFGLFFPLVASLILVYQNRLSPGLASIVQVQRGEPLLWIIDTAPLFLGLFAYFAGVRQESLLHLMENLNRVMLENIPDSALILDEQQRVIDLNASALQVLGLSKLQAQRWPVSSVVPGWPRAIGVLQSARVPEHWETTID
ncbi:MAG: PAS domain-containing protein, partial [Anaerolineales bacterium]|nr:PAS domain-containing protein [Anaerolineales bacterium]